MNVNFKKLHCNELQPKAIHPTSPEPLISVNWFDRHYPIYSHTKEKSFWKATRVLTSWRSIRWPQTAAEAWTSPCTRWWGSLGASLAPPWGSSCSSELDSARERHSGMSADPGQGTHWIIPTYKEIAVMANWLHAWIKGAWAWYTCPAHKGLKTNGWGWTSDFNVQTGFYLHGRFEGGGVRVVRQALAIALLFDAQQDLDVLTVLIAAGLLVALHPRLEFVLPQRRVLRRLLLWSSTLREREKKKKKERRQLLVKMVLPEDSSTEQCCSRWVYLNSGGLSGPFSEGLPDKVKTSKTLLIEVYNNAKWGFCTQYASTWLIISLTRQIWPS